MRYTHRLKMLLKGCAATAVISILLFSSFFVTPAFATATVTAVKNLTAGQGILPNSPPTALLRVEITFASGDSLTGIEAAVINSSGREPDCSDINRGLTLFRNTSLLAFSVLLLLSYWLRTWEALSF